jgi:hypothetical protein
MSALIDSHKQLQIEYNSRPIRDANSKKYCFAYRNESGTFLHAKS